MRRSRLPQGSSRGGNATGEAAARELRVPGVDVGDVEMDEPADLAVPRVLGQIQGQAVARHLHEHGIARVEAVLPVDPEAQALDVEALAARVVRDAERGEDLLHAAAFRLLVRVTWAPRSARSGCRTGRRHRRARDPRAARRRRCVQPARRQRSSSSASVAHEQRRVRLVRGSEVALDAEVDLHVRALEPAAAALGEVRRLRHFGEPEHAGVEAPRRGLAPGRHRELDVIDRQDAHAQKSTRPAPASGSMARRMLRKTASLARRDPRDRARSSSAPSTSPPRAARWWSCGRTTRRAARSRDAALGRRPRRLGVAARRQSERRLVPAALGATRGRGGARGRDARCSTRCRRPRRATRSTI